MRVILKPKGRWDRLRMWKIRLTKWPWRCKLGRHVTTWEHYGYDPTSKMVVLFCTGCGVPRETIRLDDAPKHVVRAVIMIQREVTRAKKRIQNDEDYRTDT